jgi:hypothetical protein
MPPKEKKRRFLGDYSKINSIFAPIFQNKPFEGQITICLLILELQCYEQNRIH